MEIEAGYTPKVCPVLLRQSDAGMQILAFRHPLAGCQLVKGTLEAGETPAEGVLRELAEESGIDHAVVVQKMGELRLPDVAQHWHIFLCQPSQPLPDTWTFFTTDGGGHIFTFFWHDLARAPDDEWHDIFKTALEFIRNRSHKR